MKNKKVQLSRNSKSLMEASLIAGQELNNLVSFVQDNFKVNRLLATMTTATIIGSCIDQIKEEKLAQENIQEIIDELSKYVEN